MATDASGRDLETCMKVHLSSEVVWGSCSKGASCALPSQDCLQVLQRGLPRPLAQTLTPDPLAAGPVGPSAAEAAEALLAAEVTALLQHDAVVHPIKKRKRGQGAVTSHL